jgi:anti-sigma factor RsiW
MADYTNNSKAAACEQWQMLLTDALDGLLKPGDEAAFAAHMAICPACTALFEDARRGREWLGFLSTEPEVPAGLLDKILAKTGPGQADILSAAPAKAKLLTMPAAWQRPGFVGNVRRFADRRLLMTAAMAFFSISTTLSLTNIRLSSLSLADLRPTALRSVMERRLTMASTPIIRYCDHSHLVYEVQSTMRQLRRAAESDAQSGTDSEGHKPNNDAPGESRHTPGPGGRSAPRQAPLQTGNPTIEPAVNDTTNTLETSLTLQARPALSGGSAMAPRERSTQWTA